MKVLEANVMSDPTKPEVVIVGGGPGGLMLAYQLVTNGIPTRVIERHPDFAREFRGEYLQSSVFAALDEMRILPELIEKKLALADVERIMYIGANRRVQLPGGREPGKIVPQESFLQLVHEACAKHAHYTMDFK